MAPSQKVLAALASGKGFFDVWSVREVITSALGKTSERKRRGKLLPTKMRSGLRLYSLGGIVLVSPLVT